MNSENTSNVEEIDAETYKKEFAKKTKKNKYGNRRIRVDGHLFASLAEAARYCELDLLRKGGKICQLQVHPKALTVKLQGYDGKEHELFTYVADFCYLDNEKERWVFEDVKGKVTDVYRIKRKAFKILCDAPLVEISPNDVDLSLIHGRGETL